MIGASINNFSRTSKLTKAYQAFELILLVTSAHLIWVSLVLFLHTDGPFVVVISGSQEPHFYRGDILLTNNLSRDFKVGDLISFRLGNRNIPIVHRLIEIRIGPNGQKQYLTKGDNNSTDDKGLYPPGQTYILEKDIISKPLCVIPIMGYFNLLVNDWPINKLLLFGYILYEAFMSI
ncbi:MAG: Signal peptidase complex catalytic subunit S11C [Marteilia pararefringens]